MSPVPDPLCSTTHLLPSILIASVHMQRGQLPVNQIYLASVSCLASWTGPSAARGQGWSCLGCLAPIPDHSYVFAHISHTSYF